MLTAKTMTSNSENHNAQRIVIIPFHFRVSSPCKTYSCAKRRAGIPDGRPPANRYPAPPWLEHRWATASGFKQAGMGTQVLLGDQRTRTVDGGASVTTGTVWPSPVSASTRAARLCGISWSCTWV